MARDCYRRNKPTERLAAGVGTTGDDSPQPSRQHSRTQAATEPDDRNGSMQDTGELRSDDYIHATGQFDTQVSSPGNHFEQGCLLIDSCFSCY